MINFAVIGTSSITESFIRHATGNWQLRAVYSRSADTASAFATKHAVKNIHVSLETLANDGTLDAVYVASPNSLHFEQAKVLLAAGKHVVVEKPATSTPAEFEELCALAKQHKVFLLEAYRHIHEANFKILRDSLARVGPIHGASLTYASYSSRYDNVLRGETPNIFSLDFSGGALVDLGVYGISAAVALFGAPVRQTYKPVVVATGADGGGFVLLEYPTFGVSINASKIYTSTAPSEIYGQNGTIVLNGVTDISRVAFLDAKTKSTEELAGPKAELNLMEEAAEFARIIESGDVETAARLEEISRAVINVTSDLRRQNGLLFKVER